MGFNAKKAAFFLTAALAVGGGASAVKHRLFEPYKVNKAAQQQVQKPQELYFGGFLDNVVGADRLYCYQRMTGQHVDIALRFTNFLELSSGKPFPAAEAQLMRQRGGALYLVLEPGSGRKPVDRSFRADRIAAGDYDNELESFAQQALDYGGPVFLTFRPQSGNGASAADVKNAYLRIRRVVNEDHTSGLADSYRQIRQIAGETRLGRVNESLQRIERVITDNRAKNVTWVWSINLDDPQTWQSPPPADQFSWVAVTAYDEAGLNKLSDNIAAIKALGKPLIVEFGSSAPAGEKGSFLKQAVARITDKNGINAKALIQFNVSQVDGNTVQPWALSAPADQTAFVAGLNGVGSTTGGPLLRENVLLSGGYLPDKSGAPPAALDCAQVESHYQNAAQTERLRQLRETIDEHENYLNGLIGGDPHYDNKKRLALAQAYTELAQATQENKYLDRADQVLQDVFTNPDPALVYHPEKRFVRESFEAQLQLASLYATRKEPRQAIDLLDQVMADLQEFKEPAFFNPLQWQRESVPGFESRTNLELARNYQKLQDYGRARELLEGKTGVLAWARSEATRSWIVLKFSLEDRTKVRFLQASAALELGRISLLDNAKVDPLTYFHEVLSLPESGSEDGFMDKGLEALVLSLHTCRKMHPTSLADAKTHFSQALPWPAINGYADLKKALGTKANLGAAGADVWDIVLDGLNNYPLLGPEMQKVLNEVRLFSDPGVR
jgi:hypothetical protein